MASRGGGGYTEKAVMGMNLQSWGVGNTNCSSSEWHLTLQAIKTERTLYDNSSQRRYSFLDGQWTGHSARATRLLSRPDARPGGVNKQSTLKMTSHPSFISAVSRTHDLTPGAVCSGPPHGPGKRKVRYSVDKRKTCLLKDGGRPWNRVIYRKGELRFNGIHPIKS